MAQRTCIVEGCSAPHVARGWCRTHYNRWHYAGSVDPLTAPPPAPTECKHCGGRLRSKRRTGPASSYCSRRCRNLASYARNRDRYNAEARADNARRLAATVSTCIECGESFTPEVSARKSLCSPECERRRARRKMDSVSATCSESECDRNVRAKGLCNMHYKRVLRAEGRMNDKNWTPRKRSAWEARNALIRGAEESSPFNRADIFERDGWVCGICLDAVDRELAYPHPMSASLDHVTPVSLGGSHSPENVQCSHLTCNVRKGNRVGAA